MTQKNSIKTYTWSGSNNANSVFIAPNTLEGRASDDLKVKVGNTLLNSNQYSLPVNLGITHVQFNKGFTPNVGDPIRIYRETKHNQRLVDFVDGSLLTSETLDLDSTQLFYMAQEAYDKGEETTIGRESFYYSQGTDPTDDDANIVNTGALWYDTSSSTNTLQVWSGTEWQATAPAKVKKTYQRVTTNGFIQVANNAHSAGKTKFADTAFKTHSSLYLNGVKLVEASTLANIPSKGDYFLSGGDVILLNLSSDTDVLVSETFDGSFSSSVTASEANALSYKNQAGQSAAGASQSAGQASDYRGDALDYASDATKYAINAKDQTFTTSSGIGGQYSAKHYAETAAASATTATGSTGAGNSKLQTVGTDLQLGSNSKIKKVSDKLDKVEDVADKLSEVEGVYDKRNEITALSPTSVLNDIGTVAGKASEIGTLAGVAPAISTVSNMVSADITKVAAIDDKVTAVANIDQKVVDVHGKLNQINTLTTGTNLDKIEDVANDINDVRTVASLEEDINTLAADSYKGVIETVAETNYKQKVEALAEGAYKQKVETVATAASDIDTITTGANLSNIGTVVSNMSAVQGASSNASSAAASAATATTKASEASVSETNARTYMNNTSGHANTTSANKIDAQEAQAAAEAAQALAESASTYALQSKTQAAASASGAATSELNAASSATSAKNSEDQAEVYMNTSNAWGSFYQKRYLGDKTSNPSVDNAGNALQNGALYFNTSDNTMYVYNGSAWVAAQSTINNVTYGANLAANLNTNNHDISFGDNDKAQFGAGNDLQIFHNGNHSFITDTGAGSLYVRASDAVWIQSADNESMAKFNANGSVDLSYNNVTKLSTTSTGIKVLGDIEQTTGDLKYTGAINWDIAHHGAGQNIVFSTTPSGGSATQRMRITSTGNVGIGTPSPATALDISQSNARGAYLRSSTTGSRMHFLDATTSSVTTVGIGAEGNNLVLHGGGSEFMRVASSGNVGIGTTNPAYKLDVYEATGNGVQIKAGDALTDKALSVGSAGTPDKFVVQAGGNVGIGTASPSTALDVVGSYGTTPVKLLRHGNNGSVVTLGRNGVDAGVTLDYPASNTLGISTNGSERMRVASSGNVGIGTTSPSAKLDVVGEATFGSGTYGVKLSYSNSATAGVIDTADSADKLSIRTGGSEKMRIDSSGNLLVGTTSIVPQEGTHGFVARANGYTIASVDDARVMLLNRAGNDGEILNFRKDGQPVGSIGTTGGDMYVGTGDTGIRFDDATNHIRPCGVDGANLDATIDIGDSSRRFKDIYLSGGVHLGGTGDANKLDDYEEGTFTLNTAGDSSGVFQDTPTCLYTKIGNTVNVFITFRVGTNFTSQNVGGLPFTTSHTGMNSSYLSGGIAITSNNNTVSVTVGNNGTTIRFHDNQNTSDAHLPNTTDEYYRLNFTYKTA